MKITLIKILILFLSLTSFAEEKNNMNVENPLNIILIFTDDQGYQDLGCYGSKEIKTPNIDHLASEGMKFSDFYVVSPVCTPSRVGLLTGKYPKRLGLAKGVLFPNSKDKGLSPKENTIAKFLKNKDYATACIGKWHLGHRLKYLPTSNGFDYYYGVPYSNDMWIAPELKLDKNILLRDGVSKSDLEIMRQVGGLNTWAEARKYNNRVPLMENESVIEFPADQATLSKRYAEQSVEFIKSNKDKPFFLYLAPAMPHIPLFVSENFSGKSKGGLYGDTIEEIDWAVGQIMRTLEEEGIVNNTLIIFTSDNGPALRFNDHGGHAFPFRSGKATVFEGGMRVPCIMRFPNLLPPQSVCTNLFTSLDIFPTIIDLFKDDIDDKIDGSSLFSLLDKDYPEQERSFIYYTAGGKAAAIRSGLWKLIFSIPVGDYAEPNEVNKYRGKSFSPELYNLGNDPSEKYNLYGTYPKKVEELFKKAIHLINQIEN